MQAEMPFYEGPEDALKACIQALGGAKRVAPELWPDKSMDSASRLLLDCLNPDRSEKLGYSQVIWIFRKAKQIGFHAAYDWYSRECEYAARPITSAEEADRLTTVIEQATKALAMALPALERIQQNNSRG